MSNVFAFIGRIAQTTMGGFLFPRPPNCSELLRSLGFCCMECSNDNGGFSVPKMVFIEKSWFLLDGEVNDNGGFPVSKCSRLKSMGFYWTGTSTTMGGFRFANVHVPNVVVFVRRGRSTTMGCSGSTCRVRCCVSMLFSRARASSRLRLRIEIASPI